MFLSYSLSRCWEFLWKRSSKCFGGFRESNWVEEPGGTLTLNSSSTLRLARQRESGPCHSLPRRPALCLCRYGHCSTAPVAGPWSALRHQCGCQGHQVQLLSRRLHPGQCAVPASDPGTAHNHWISDALRFLHRLTAAQARHSAPAASSAWGFRFHLATADAAATADARGCCLGMAHARGLRPRAVGPV